MIAVDTNILVYAFDTAYPEKRKICREILIKVFEGRETIVVTNQILAEFVHTITQKIENPLNKEQTCAIIGALLTCAHCKILDYTSEMVLHAVTSENPFWDALIAQTLKENNVTQLLTENTKDFVNSGISVRNPFKQ